jgi:hypothetical protein
MFAHLDLIRRKIQPLERHRRMPERAFQAADSTGERSRAATAFMRWAATIRDRTRVASPSAVGGVSDMHENAARTWRG